MDEETCQPAEKGQPQHDGHRDPPVGSAVGFGLLVEPIGQHRSARGRHHREQSHQAISRRDALGGQKFRNGTKLGGREQGALRSHEADDGQHERHAGRQNRPDEGRGQDQFDELAPDDDRAFFESVGKCPGEIGQNEVGDGEGDQSQRQDERLLAYAEGGNGDGNRQPAEDAVVHRAKDLHHRQRQKRRRVQMIASCGCGRRDRGFRHAAATPERSLEKPVGVIAGVQDSYNGDRAEFECNETESSPESQALRGLDVWVRRECCNVDRSIETGGDLHGADRRRPVPALPSRALTEEWPDVMRLAGGVLTKRPSAPITRFEESPTASPPVLRRGTSRQPGKTTDVARLYVS